MTKSGVWKAIRGLVAVVLGLCVAAYVGMAAYLYVNQDRMLYPRPRGAESPASMGLPIENVTLTTPDGEHLQAWYEPPKPGMPVILFLHGNAATLAKSQARYVRMHLHGVGYLALAYRGYSGSSGVPTEKGLLSDGLTAYDFLRAKGFRDSDIVLHGHSLGTGVATWLATQRPARALILEAPFTAISDVGAARYPYMPVALLLRDHYLSRQRIRDVHMPVLIAHGDLDRTVPFAQGQRLFERANAPKTFVRIRGGHHNTLTADGVYIYYWKFLGVPLNDQDRWDLAKVASEK